MLGTNPDLLIHSYLSLTSVWVWFCLKNSEHKCFQHAVVELQLLIQICFNKHLLNHEHAEVSRLSWVSFHSILSRIVGYPNDYRNPNVKPQASFLSHQNSSNPIKYPKSLYSHVLLIPQLQKKLIKYLSGYYSCVTWLQTIWGWFQKLWHCKFLRSCCVAEQGGC